MRQHLEDGHRVREVDRVPRLVNQRRGESPDSAPSLCLSPPSRPAVNEGDSPGPQVSLIAEDIQFVNRRLKKSQYFYIDIKREGILLHDSGAFELAEPKELSVQERKKLAEEDFKYWYLSFIFKAGAQYKSKNEQFANVEMYSSSFTQILCKIPRV